MFRRHLLALLLTLLAFPLFLVALVCYARYIEPYWVEEVAWDLPCAAWKGRPVKLAVVADLHAKPGDGDFIDSVVQRILDAKPDAVLMLGDFMSGHNAEQSMDLSELAEHLRPLAGLPCFAVCGNHDYYHGIAGVRAMLQSLGVPSLEGKRAALEVGGDTLYLGGVRCLCHFYRPGTVPALPEDDKDAALLLLSHSPAGARYAKPGTTATLAGHTHGGQVCLPGGIPFIRPDNRVRWEEVAGAYEEQGRPVYVTRGLGSSILPFRLFCRPELTFVMLHGEP